MKSARFNSGSYGQFQGFFGKNRRRPLLRDTLLALILFGAAFWSTDSLELFDWLVEASQLFPAWRIQQIISALPFGLAGYVVLVIARLHFMNLRLIVGETGNGRK